MVYRHIVYRRRARYRVQATGAHAATGGGTGYRLQATGYRVQGTEYRVQGPIRPMVIR